MGDRHTKGFFKEAGVDVKFEWLDYVASMDAFASNKVDAVSMTNGDGLVTGATGKKGIGILLNDFSNGNDMVVASADIKSIADLKDWCRNWICQPPTSTKGS